MLKSFRVNSITVVLVAANELREVRMTVKKTVKSLETFFITCLFIKGFKISEIVVFELFY